MGMWNLGHPLETMRGKADPHPEPLSKGCSRFLHILVYIRRLTLVTYPLSVTHLITKSVSHDTNAKNYTIMMMLGVFHPLLPLSGFQEWKRWDCSHVSQKWLQAMGGASRSSPGEVGRKKRIYFSGSFPQMAMGDCPLLRGYSPFQESLSTQPHFRGSVTTLP
jgi:hypothetical protein